jgi:hypothetical protein
VVAAGRVGSLPRAADGFSLFAVVDGAVVRLRQNPTVQVLHAGADAPAVDVFAGSAELIDDLAFRELSAPVRLPPGDYSVDLFAHAAGAMRPAGSPAFTVALPTLAAGERYLAVATGLLGGQGASAFRVLALRDGFDLDAAAALRFVHAAADVPAVNVGPVANGQVVKLFEDVAFGQSSAEAGAAVAPATYPIGVAVAPSQDPALTFEVGVSAGLRAFAIATGLLAGQPSIGVTVVNTSVWPWSAATLSPVQ